MKIGASCGRDRGVLGGPIFIGPGSGAVDLGILWAVDFRTLAVGAGGTLPNSLQFARAANSKGNSETVQTSDQTLVTSGLTANVPRIGQRTASSAQRGLVLEPQLACVNFSAGTSADNRGFSPTLGGGSFSSSSTNVPTVTNTSTGPDGTTGACRVQTVGTNSYYVSAVTGQLAHYWARATTGTATLSSNYDNSAAINTALTTSWQRVELGTPGSTGSIGFVYWYDQGAAGLTGATTSNQDMILDWRGQYANGAGSHHMETIVSSSQRSGERLYLASNAPLLSSNRIGLEYLIIPKGAATEYAANMRLFTIDVSNYAEFNFSTRIATVVVAGASYSVATAASWSRYDSVQLWVEAGGGSLNTVVKLAVNGGATTTLGTSGAPQGTVGAGSIDFCSNGTSNQLTSWLQTVTAYKSGYRPAWAA